MSTQLSEATAPRSQTAGGRRFRPDIQGLRALAILAVVAYHAGVPGVSGGFVGVDFFFVLSGFLITGLLVEEVFTSGRVSLAAFWGRRARRLLPASAVVLLATALASYVWLPLLDRKPVSGDIAWAALFSSNWRFAQQQTDYLAQDRTASPVLHYWSLGVEEQFYVVWPLLIALVAALVARRVLAERRLPLVLFGTFGVITVASFAYCVWETSHTQPYAFFGTPARAWQLALGAALAVATPALLRLSRHARTVLAVAGATGFAVSLAWLSERGAGGLVYPGALALLPTLAAALLIASGTGDGAAGFSRALSVRPLQWIGDRSYSWYLWHWPVFVFLPLAVGSESWPWRAVAVALSLALAAASYAWIEQPVRGASALRRSPARSLALGAVLTVLALAAARLLGSVAFDGEVVDLEGNTVVLHPNPVDAASDVFSMRNLGCDLDYEETEIDADACLFGDPDGERSLLLVGDSHAVAVFPGLDKAAKAEGWQVHSWTKSACPLADVTRFDRARQQAFTECDDFRESLTQRVTETRPDLVVAAMAYNPAARLVDRDTGDLYPKADTEQLIVAGLRATLERYTAAGIPVLLIKDLPPAPFNPPSCLVETRHVSECLVRNPRGVPVEEQAAAGLAGVSLFDLREGVCRPRWCNPVKGSTLVYRDTNHITKTYALRLAGRFEDTLRSVS